MRYTPRRMGRKSRDSNLELLRIVSMFVIVLCHTSFCVRWEEIPTGSMLLRFGADLGVNSFVLISGYYMIQSRITAEKILRLWVTVFSYSAGIYFLLIASGMHGVEINARSLYKFCSPLVSGHYWFASAYMLLMLISPILNKAIKAIDKKSLLLGIVVIALFDGLTFGRYGGRLLGFCILYSIAAYVRLYGAKLSGMRAIYWFSIAFFLFLSVEICSVYAPLDFVVTPGTGNPLMLALSVSVFLGFVSLQIKHIPWINKLSACTFGVYLLHCHRGLSNLIWDTCFDIQSLADSPWLLPYCLGSALIIYSLCTVIEMLRGATLGRLYDKVVSLWLRHLPKKAENNMLKPS